MKIMLDMSYNEITAEDVSKVEEKLINGKFKKANFSSLEDFKNSFIYLASILRENKILREVDFSGNKFGDEEIKLLLEIIKVNKSLIKIQVDMLTPEQKKEVINVLQENFALE